jgi:formate dehydrogenase subunit gamma
MSASRVLPGEPVGIVHREGSILRYTLEERVNHWFGALTYSYCLITGLAFWSPYMYWLAAIVGGGPTARFWHPWFGVAFTVSMIVMYVHWYRDMEITDADERWKGAMEYYVKNEDEKVPPEGRFNYGQKLFFWLMFFGVFLLLISGIGLWFVEDIPWSLRWLRYLAVTVHVATALATIGAFIIHVYMSTAMVRGSFTAMVRGEVSTLWAKTHHRLWYEQVTGDKPRKDAL